MAFSLPACSLPFCLSSSSCCSLSSPALSLSLLPVHSVTRALAMLWAKASSGMMLRIEFLNQRNAFPCSCVETWSSMRCPSLFLRSYGDGGDCSRSPLSFLWTCVCERTAAAPVPPCNRLCTSSEHTTTGSCVCVIQPQRQPFLSHIHRHNLVRNEGAVLLTACPDLLL